MVPLVIVNARIVDAEKDFYGCVCVDDGLIAHVGKSLPEGFAGQLVDARGLVLMPALRDMHTHLRDPGFPQKETIESGMHAALSGGFARLAAMANTKPVIDSPELVEINLGKAKDLKLCRLIQAAAAGVGLKDEQPTDYAALSVVTPFISNDGNTIFSDSFMEQLLIASEYYGFVISTHCQPERKTTERDIGLLEHTGGKLHVGHISHRETLHLIRKAKQRGLGLSCEVTPHHLIGYDCAYRVNPPLRTHADVTALIEGCVDGSIDCLATDHAPHTPADKEKGMAGISNIEYALAVFWRVFSENGISLQRLSQMGAQNPALLLGENAGLVKVGMEADLILFDPDEEYCLDADNMISLSHNTPFCGERLKGRVHKTIVEGEIRYEYNR